MAAYEKSRKKKDPDLDRNTLKPRLPEEILRKIVKAKINSPACMNKGFILDGFPRNREDAREIFQDIKIVSEEDKEKDPSLVDTYETNEKIAPQYVVMFEAEDAYLKTRAKEIGAMPVTQRQENHTEAQFDKRIKIYRTSNPDCAHAEHTEKHLLAFFHGMIGESNCMLRMLAAHASEEKTP